MGRRDHLANGRGAANQIYGGHRLDCPHSSRFFFYSWLIKIWSTSQSNEGAGLHSKPT